MNPLFVDLDGTLLFNDSVQESFFRLLLKHPFIALASIFLLITQGKAAFKNNIAQHLSLDAIRWQINPAVLEKLEAEKKLGRKIILLTASHETIARAIVEPLNIFDQIIGSTAVRNFKGKQKLAWIQEHFPHQTFDYAGNSCDDFLLWEHCAQAIVVNPAKSVYAHAKKINPNIQLIHNQPSKFSLWRRALRLHQTCKNLLIFIPLLLSGQLFHWMLFIPACLAWCAFSSMACSCYLINDLIDLDHDRAHHTKKYRPLAAGQLNIASTMIACILLVATAIVFCCFLPLPFTLSLMIYGITTLAYSFIFKKIAILDVFILSGLYLLRIIAGSAATNIMISYWLFAFALFFFLSLAYLKRFIELGRLSPGEKINGRNYLYKDIELVKNFGISLGFLSVLVFSLYLSSQATIAIYQHPNGLWLIALFLLYWINYVWYAANHHSIHDDPIEFAVTDKTSLALGACIITTLLFCQGFF